MLLDAVKGLTGFLPVAYALVLSLYVSLLFRDDPERRSPRATRSLLLVALVHLAALLLRGFALSHCPIATGFELASFVALAIVATHLIVERATGFQSPGIPALGLALVLQMLATSYLRYDTTIDDNLRAWPVPLHAMLGMLGHAGFFTAGCYALLYLILYRQIKAKRLDRVWQRLPPLETMHRMCFWAAGIGLLFLSMSIASGLLWAWHRGLRTEPLGTSVLSWVAFAGLLFVGKLKPLSGRRFSSLALVVTLLDTAALIFTEILHTRHLGP